MAIQAPTRPKQEQTDKQTLIQTRTAAAVDDSAITCP